MGVVECGSGWRELVEAGVDRTMAECRGLKFW